MKTLGPIQKTVVGAQFLFVAFGATVLVPLLVGLDPSVALMTAGVGTLIFHAVTKGKVPIFLGSSFAFIAPIIKATELFGLPGALFGIRCRPCVRSHESAHTSSRSRLHHTTLPSCRSGASDHADRTFAGGNRCGYGEEQLAPGHHCASDNCRRIAFCQRTPPSDPYLCRNHSRIHCLNLLRTCGFPTCP